MFVIEVSSYWQRGRR